MDFLISALVVYGLVNILVNGAIFSEFRDMLASEAGSTNSKFVKLVLLKLHKLFSCIMCSGFWAGLTVGFFLGPFYGWQMVFNGFIYSGTSWILNALVQFLGAGYDPSRTLNVIIQDESKIQVKVEKNG
jgi:hypothetical protein